MNLKLASYKLSQATLAISLGLIVCPESAKSAETVINPNNQVIENKPVLLFESNPQKVEDLVALEEKSSDTVIVSSEEIKIIEQEQQPEIVASLEIDVQSIDVESVSTSESVSIPIKVENKNNKNIDDSVNIPVVPTVTEQVMIQQTEANPVVTLDNTESSSSSIASYSDQQSQVETIVSQKIEVVSPNKTNKQGRKKQSNTKEDFVSTVSIPIEQYDPTNSPSLEGFISPNIPKMNSPEPHLPEVTQKKSKGYVWPAKGVFTSGYGWRWGRMHRGIDIAAPIGTPIIAAADGKVVSAGWNSGGYGNLVKVKHFDGSITLYAHNSKIMVRNGQFVKQGQQIAKMGSTGFSTGHSLTF